MKNSEITEGALEVIREKGWTKRQYRDRSGYCLLGAAMSAMGVADLFLAAIRICHVPEVDEPFETAMSVIKPGLPDGGTVIWRYNDGPTTTQEDVEQVLIDASKYWRDRGE